jgi:Ca-activated chloride channel homolog
MHRITRTAILLALWALLGWGSAQTYVELILDASGSMWNQLDDGRYRIVAAKEVLSDFVSSLPADAQLNVGLRIYGSELRALEEGACEDSRLFVPLRGVDRDALLESVAAAEAQGATPIAYSLLEAAQDFPADAERRLIVLVTDGEESCGGDLQAVARELAQQGFEVDIRIIGFDLDDAAIRSFEGVGTFENARSAQELAAALGRAVEDVAQARETVLPVTATVTLNGQPQSASVTFIDVVTERKQALPASAPGQHEGQLPAGTYRALVASEAGIDQEFADLSVTPEGDNAFTFDLQAVNVALSVSPTDPLAGSPVTVSFEGAPAESGDLISVVPVGAPDSVLLNTQNVRQASGSVQVRTPDAAETLEARYYTRSARGGRTVIARSAPFSTRALSVTLEAPAEVNAGAPFEVAWTGESNDSDFITVVPAESSPNTIGNHRRANQGSPSLLAAPVEPGNYEVRYVTDQTRQVVARVPIVVNAIGITLTGPDEASAGGEIEVAFNGPANANDFLTIVPADSHEATVDNHRRVNQGNPAVVQVPSEPGEYEIRYVTEQSPRRALARLPLTVTGLGVTLEADPETTAGSVLTVRFDGATNGSDFITIVPAGSPPTTIETHRRVQQGNPAEVGVPATAGEYEIRYVTNETPRTVYATIPLRVLALDMRLEAAPEAQAGSEIDVAFEGPANPDDFITIVPAGSPATTIENHRRARQGNPAAVQVPDVPGDYEVRYVTNQTPRTVYAELPLTVTELGVSLEAPASAAPGEVVAVTLAGNGNPGDFVTIVPAGSPANTIGTHRRVRELERGIAAPTEPGEYEVRYVTEQSRRVVARVVLMVR